MGSIDNRLARLERNLRPAEPSGSSETPPIMTLLLKSVARARAEIDGQEPLPLDLTDAEIEADREATIRFRPYLRQQKQLAVEADNADTVAAIERATEWARAELEK